RLMVATLVALTVGTGFLFAWLWRDDALLLLCYLATWLAFSLYSLPPFRFKERGAAGVLCDAAGEQLFPALVAAFLACRGAQRAVIGVPKLRFFIVLHQFYSDLFPVALLITASVRDRRVLIVLAAHLLLFPRRVIHAIRRLRASTARTVVNASEPHHGGVG